jgi:hypothetical protein
MGKVWVLDTETKGTGANVVPLEKVLKRPTPAAEPLFVPPKREPPPRDAPAPPAPRVFKVVDIMTRRTLLESAGTRETLDLLSGVRSIVDVNIYVWQPDGEKWRLLTFDERRTLWELRDAGTSSTDAEALPTE